MKRVLLYIAIAIAAIGCAKDETTDNINTNGEINLSAGVTTRVSDTDDCKWKIDDEVGIYTSEDIEDNLLFKISDTETGALANNSETPLYTLLSGARTYYAYHPYDSTLSKETTTIAVDCTTDQSNFILWATATSNDTEVPLQFAHKYAKVQFSLTAGGIDVTSLEGAKAWLTGANSAGTFDVKTGEFTITATDKIELAIDSNNTITAYLPPVDAVKDNVKLWINAQDNTFLKTFTDEAWESGSSYTYDISVGEVLNIAYDSDADTYQLYTADGLFAFADMVNGGNTSFNGTLMRDIDLGGAEWTPIGDSSNKYSGIFDGGGYEVKNIYINNESDYQGLFGYTDGAKIKNVGVSGSITGGNYVGGVVGYAASSSSVTSCYNLGTVTSETVTATGGYSTVGGVVGYADYSSVTSCYNLGNVRVSGDDGYYEDFDKNLVDPFYVGGVVGYTISSSVTSCYNVGDVTASGSYTTVGGVVGCAYSSSSVTSCYNVGVVTASGSDAHIGGVVGFAYSSTATSCYNVEDVTVSGSGANVGGVMGLANSCSVISCYNSGDVTASGGDAYVGGVVGDAFSSCSVTSCYNSGTVTASGSDTAVSGVVGRVVFSSMVKSCYSYGSVSSVSSSYLGGVVGWNPSGTVSYCYYDTSTVGANQIIEGTQYYAPTGAVQGSDGTTYYGFDSNDTDAMSTLLTNLQTGSSNYWQADNATSINNGYPILTWQIVND